MTDAIVQGVVSNLVKEVQGVGTRSQASESYKKLLPSLLRKGIDSVDFSMFSFSTRNEILNAMGDEYIRRGNFEDAQKSFVLASNKVKLQELGDEYARVGLFAKAVESFKLG